MDGGDTQNGDTGDVDDEQRPPAAGQTPMAWSHGAGGRSEWSINWPAVVPVLILVIVMVMVWRAFEGGDDPDAGAADDVVDTVATTAPPTTVRSTTTVAPTTVVTTTTSTVPERQVVIRAEMKPCRFSDDCLVASFTVEGFEQTSGQFTCIYPNSQRDFSFQDGGKDDACITADEGDTITIVVDGVRSATVSEENLTGAP